MDEVAGRRVALLFPPSATLSIYVYLNSKWRQHTANEGTCGKVTVCRKCHVQMYEVRWMLKPKKGHGLLYSNSKETDKT